MKICFFNSYPAWGGGVKFYLDFAFGMKTLGHEVIAICSPDSHLSQSFKKEGIKLFEVAVNNRSVLNPFKVFRIVKILQAEKIEAIVFTTSEDLKLGALSAKIAGVRTIAYRRGLAVPIKNRWSNRFIFKKLVTHILANSQETKKTLLKHLSQVVDEANVKVIYNGINTSKSLDTDQNKFSISPYPSKGILLGNAGRLVPQKGQMHLIEIAKLLKSKGIVFTLYIAGSGELRPELEKAIRKYDLEAEVHLVGYVENISSFMKELDIFLLTSLWEGFGYVLAEAALQGKPTVAYDISSNPEVVEDGETGFLVPPNDIEMFVDKIIELTQNVDLRNHFGSSAVEKVTKQFELRRQIKKFEQFITN